MSDVNETLQDLMERRLREMGKRRGRGESISLREAYQRFVDQVADQNARGGPDAPIQVPTYEVFRRIRNGHTRISDPTASALATMLGVDVNDVYAAAGQPPRLGRFELPSRADRLDGQQRAVVLNVVDAILDAAGTGRSGDRPPAEVRELRVAAARDTGKLSKQQQRDRAGARDDDYEPR